MRLYLINPSNSVVSMLKVRDSLLNRFRVWKPLSLLVLAGLTPQEWDITIIDENISSPDYNKMPRPDLVGITAFTAQANRAYEVSDLFRKEGVPVVMGGIHATMCYDEAKHKVDSIVVGEAESVWGQVLKDVKNGALQKKYDGGFADMKDVPLARHSLLPKGYAFGAIQTTRGCPLSCVFCSVTAFNGTHYRQRPIEDVIREFHLIHEKRVLLVDDNLIGTRADHIARAKDLFRAMITTKVGKKWIAQVTINFADDDELLDLAAKAGCSGVFIGFESSSAEGLVELGKKFNGLKGRNFRASVRRIQRYGISVVGSFILGLDVDKPGIGKHVADVATGYGVDIMNVLFLTPLPGTKLWEQMKSAERLPLNNFPSEWKYYTLTFPVAQYKHFSLHDIVKEMSNCDTRFYSFMRIFFRVLSSLVYWREPMVALVGNLSFKSNLKVSRKSHRNFLEYCGQSSRSSRLHKSIVSAVRKVVPLQADKEPMAT